MPTKRIAALDNQLLDARPDRLDLRDRKFMPRVRSLPPQFPANEVIDKFLPSYVSAGLVLDQQKEGACTGFGLACVINYLRWEAVVAQIARTSKNVLNTSAKTIHSVSPRMLYHLARFYDEWPGESYSGSSCRGALRGWHRHGVCHEEFWPYLQHTKNSRASKPSAARVKKGTKKAQAATATRASLKTSKAKNAAAHFIPPKVGWQKDAFETTLGVYYRIDRNSIVDIQAAIIEMHAVYVSSDVHDGWNLDAVPLSKKDVIKHLPRVNKCIDENSLGGHAFAIVGYTREGFIVQNSWGTKWAASGFALLPYDEWTKHGTDAWVVALGVPAADASNKVRAKQSPNYYVQTRSDSADESHRGALANLGGNTASGFLGDLFAKALPQPENTAVEPLDKETAYAHTIVTDNDGVVCRIVEHENAQDTVRKIVLEQSLQHASFRTKKKIALYFHGGLNSEADSITRIRVLAPYFLKNDIYPVFITWRTGFGETVAQILKDAAANAGPEISGGMLADMLARLADKWDRSIEVVARPIARPIWSEMKENAQASAQPGRGLDLIAKALRGLIDAEPNTEVHLIGHSAGSIMIGHFLDCLSREIVKVKSCALFAPACTVDFALNHYGPALTNGTLKGSAMNVHVLSSQNELDDRVAIYNKSLLYLVSRALESTHKTPLLGLETVFTTPTVLKPVPDSDLIALWEEGRDNTIAGIRDLFIQHQVRVTSLAEAQVEVVTIPRSKSIKASHGCFDNSIKHMSDALEKIKGSPLAVKIENLDY